MLLSAKVIPARTKIKAINPINFFLDKVSVLSEVENSGSLFFKTKKQPNETIAETKNAMVKNGKSSNL